MLLRTDIARKKVLASKIVNSEINKTEEPVITRLENAHMWGKQSDNFLLLIKLHNVRS
jgi:hypothetical protein